MGYKRGQQLRGGTEEAMGVKPSFPSISCPVGPAAVSSTSVGKWVITKRANLARPGREQPKS